MNYRVEQEQIIKELETRTWAGDNLASSVPISKDFGNDKRQCLTFLAFLTPSCKSKLNQLRNELNTADPSHYSYPSKSLHVTIQNVRSIANPPEFTSDDINKAIQAYKATPKDKSLFQFQLHGVLFMPNSLSVVAYAKREYADFVAALRHKMKELGVPDNKRYVSNKIVFGNTTLIRFSQSPNPAFHKIVDKYRDTFFSSFEAQTIQLVSTNAVCHPNHTKILQEFPLS